MKSGFCDCSFHFSQLPHLWMHTNHSCFRSWNSLENVSASTLPNSGRKGKKSRTPKSSFSLYGFFSLTSKTKRNNSRNNILLVPRYPNYYSQYFSTPFLNADQKTVLVPVLMPGLVRVLLSSFPSEIISWDEKVLTGDDLYLENPILKSMWISTRHILSSNKDKKEKYTYSRKKFPWFLGRCLQVFFLTPVEGRRDRWTG